MIWLIRYEQAHWGTVVVRAATEDVALDLGRRVGSTYLDPVGDVSAEQLNTDGPAEVLVEDWS